MAPKKDNIQASLDFISEEIGAINNKPATMKESVAEAKAMRLENEKKDRQIAYLEHRVAELEQYTTIYHNQRCRHHRAPGETPVIPASGEHRSVDLSQCAMR